MIVDVSPSANVVLDSNGNGRVFIGPPTGTKWAARLATLSTSTATKHPKGFLYRGSASGPLQLVDSTITGDAASSSKVGGPVFFAGLGLWAVWQGGDPGATATLQVFATQGGRTDPLPDSPLGEGFPDQIALIAQSLQLGGDGSAGNPGITLGVTPIPPELVTYYAGLTDPGHLVAGTVSIIYDGTATADYRYSGIFADNGVPPGQQVWFVEGQRGNAIVSETDRWLVNPGGAFGNPDIVFSPTIAFLVKSLIQSQVNATNAQAYEVEVAGEAGIRLTINGDGSLNWGDGTNPADVTLARVTTSVLRVPDGALSLRSSTPGFEVLRVSAVGNTSDTWTVQRSGVLGWGGGTSGVDTMQYRVSAGVLAADTIKSNVSGSGETWHNISTIGYTSPWADFGGGVQVGRYRFTVDGYVSLEGGVKTTANVSSGTVLFVMPAAYRPANDEVFGVNFDSGATSVAARLTVQAGGNVVLTSFAGPVTVGILSLGGARYAQSTLT